MIQRRAVHAFCRISLYRTLLASAILAIFAAQAGAVVAPFDPSPPDGAMNVPVSTTLQWNGISAAEGYGLWLIVSGEDLLTTYGLREPRFDPPDGLAHGTKYYWIVAASDGADLAVGPLWSFTTAIEMPHGFAPADKTTGVLVDASLSWEASAGATAYDLYFWKLMESKPVVPTASGWRKTLYLPPTDLEMTTYFWQVVAKNDSQKTVGPVLSFTTEEELAGIADWIEHFYMIVLGRAPEPGAVEAWESGYYDAAVSAGIDVRFVAREMGRLFFLGEEYAALGRSDAEFISDCYDAFLLREPSPWELAPWLDDVTTPGGPVRWNRAEVMTQFAESREFEQNVIDGGLFPNLRGDPTRNFVATMYIGVFDRLPDQGGLNYWAGVMEGAESFDDKLEEVKRMASAFFLSKEGLAKAPTNETRVVRLYRAFLGRFPADSEVLYWKGELDSGRKTLNSLIEVFGGSEEFAATLDAYFKSELTVYLPGNVPLVLVGIPAGSFEMGSPSTEQDRESDEGPVHTVNIGHDFYLGKYEVTKRQWQAVMGTTPWSGQSNVLDDPDSPAVYVSWIDAGLFLTALNAHLGATGQAVRDKPLRLPSESEWEYACRAGTQARFYWGDDPSYTQIGAYAWYDGNREGIYAHVVGRKLPNAWGLYDMSGNVWEWCQDWWHEGYSGAPTDGSAWESPSASGRVARGGCISDAEACRSASRYIHYAWSPVYHVGFRLATAR